jgi:hypothetical protein
MNLINFQNISEVDGEKSSNLKEEENQDYKLKYLNIINEMKLKFQNKQIEIIEKFKHEKISEEIEKIKKDNLIIIKTFKIPEKALQIMKIQTSKKLIEDVEYLIKKENKTFNCSELIISNKNNNQKMLKIEIDPSKILLLCKTEINLLKKYKNRIDNFITRHILPMSLLLEEKFCDFHNSFINELEYFKKFDLIYLNKEINLSIYSLKNFNYEREILTNSNLRNKADVFKLYFEFGYLNKYEKSLKSSEAKLRKNFLKNTNYLKFNLMFEKSSHIELFLNQEIIKLKGNFLEQWRFFKEIINIFIENMKFYKNIVVEWSRADYSRILKNFYLN